MLTDQEIYKKWLAKFPGPKYLKPKRWAEISKVIKSHEVKTVIEFGSGVSTMLFDNRGITVLSLETDPKYMALVRQMCSPNVTFRYWKNAIIRNYGHFDLSFVDGILPRTIQTQFAMSCTDLIAIDDMGPRMTALLTPLLGEFTRINTTDNLLAIYSRSSKK